MKQLFVTLLFTIFYSLASASTLALVQYNADAHFADYEHNMTQLTRFAEQAVTNGSKIIVFPEGSIYGYASPNAFWCRSGMTDSRCKDVSVAAETIPNGKTSDYWFEFAQRHQVYVLFNIPESDANSFFNTTAVFGPTGFVTKYRKRSLYVTDTYYATPGNLGPVTFETPYGAFGLLICMDGNYPTLFNEYKKMGIEQIILPMDWDQDPNGGGGSRPARLYFQAMARKVQMDIFVSDVSPWDGTGAYYQDRKARERNGLSDIAIGKDGVSYHELPSRPTTRP